MRLIAVVSWISWAALGAGCSGPDGGGSDSGAPDGDGGGDGGSGDGGSGDGGDGGSGSGDGGDDLGASFDDTGGPAPESCGQVVFTDSDGNETDYTDAFTVGDEVLLTRDGVLRFCTGTWFVILEVQAQVQVLGLGEVPRHTVLSGGDWGSVVAVSGSDAQVQVENVTLDRGSARGEGNNQSGGGVRCSDAARVELRSVIISNSQAYDGGGLHGRQGCVIDLDNVLFADNLSTDDGGAFRVDDSSASIRNSTFRGSQARDGGGLFSWASDVTLDGVVFEDNHSTDSQGGAILHYNGDLTVQRARFQSNTSLEVGGALSLFGDTTLDDVRFEDNSSNQGGAVFLYTDSASLQCDACDFVANQPDDVALDIGGSFTMGEDATFACDGSGCQ